VLGAVLVASFAGTIAIEQANVNVIFSYSSASQTENYNKQ